VWPFFVIEEMVLWEEKGTGVAIHMCDYIKLYGLYVYSFVCVGLYVCERERVCCHVLI